MKHETHTSWRKKNHFLAKGDKRQVGTSVQQQEYSCRRFFSLSNGDYAISKKKLLTIDTQVGKAVSDNSGRLRGQSVFLIKMLIFTNFNKARTSPWPAAGSAPQK